MRGRSPVFFVFAVEARQLGGSLKHRHPLASSKGHGTIGRPLVLGSARTNPSRQVHAVSRSSKDGATLGMLLQFLKEPVQEYQPGTYQHVNSEIDHSASKTRYGRPRR